MEMFQQLYTQLQTIWTAAVVSRNRTGTSLVAQWVRIHLPMLGTWVQSLVQADSTCLGPTKPMQLLSPCAVTTEARVPRACALQQEKQPQWDVRILLWSIAPAHCAKQWRPTVAKNKHKKQNNFLIEFNETNLLTLLYARHCMKH